MELRIIIRNTRKEKGLTQQQLAELINIRASTISDFENEKHQLGSNYLEKILNILDLQITRKK